LEKWKTLKVIESIDLKIFTAQLIKRENPKTKSTSDFVVLNSKDWVNIIPVTSDNKIVMIQQYRQGIDEITLEIPGGLVEHGEEPSSAATRECMEETGYFSPEPAILLGMIHPNPAFLNNSCYTFLWKNVEKKFETKFDKNEDIEILLVDENKIEYYIRSGKITHSIVLNAFLFYFLNKKNKIL
jgi:8-oxo-dGTP pyrophosphatase MutT (NUDIX family)